MEIRRVVTLAGLTYGNYGTKLSGFDQWDQSNLGYFDNLNHKYPSRGKNSLSNEISAQLE